MTNKGKKYKDRHNNRRRILYFLYQMPKESALKLIEKVKSKITKGEK